MSSNNESSQWNISTDIYDIVGTLDNLKSRFIDTEDETTLSLGIFGFITDTEAKKIQTATIMAGELGNEMFPNRAKLDKNIVTHAMYCNINNLNAVPAAMTVDLAIKEIDLDKYMKNDEFIFDRNCPIFVGDFEFHFDYDIILKRQQKKGTDKYFYNATYDMDDINEISTIKSPYLDQPYTASFNNFTYVFFRTIIRQVAIETIQDKLVSGSIIDNKSFTFSFEDQMASFVVYITENGKTTKLKPILYGTPVDINLKNYCWYLYMSDNNIRLGFDTSSYLPGLNAEINIIAQTTKGSEGNFSYISNDEEEMGFYFDIESELYNYKKITCYANPATDSMNGSDKKSIEELKELIPKMGLSRGYITTETDLNNYFNLINTDDNKMQLQKKIDNQLNRIWYDYLLMKDEFGNVLPTNSIYLRLKLDEFMIQSGEHNSTWMLPAGTVIKYTKYTEGGTVFWYGIPIHEEELPELFTDTFYEKDVYYYRTLYNILLSVDPLYCSYYLTIIDTYSYFANEYINDKMFMGFIVNSNYMSRKLLSDKDSYNFDFTIRQSVTEDVGLYDFNDDTNNMKVFMIVDKGGVPYKYFEGTLVSADQTMYDFKWNFELITDNQFDSDNNIKIINCKELGTGLDAHGYFEDNTSARIYILGKFDEEYGRYTLDTMIPGLEGYTLINVYSVVNGLDFYNNFTKIMNTRVVKLADGETYEIQNTPLVGAQYYTDESKVSYFIHELLKKKSYIDYCLTLVENNMDIDFKYFNTYGDSKTYTIGDREQTMLGHIDINMKFRSKLVNPNDVATKKAIIAYIKSYIENLNDSGQDLHIPNLIHDATEEFKDLVVYIEFMNFNDNRLGVNHIELKEVDNIHTVPEFITIRNRLNEDKTDIEPWIDLEIVK